MALKVTKQEDGKVTYEIANQPYNVLFKNKLPVIENIQLSQRIYDYPEVMLSSEFFNIMEKLVGFANEQRKLFEEKSSFNKYNIVEAKFSEQNKILIKKNSQDFFSELNSFLKSNNIPEVTDCTGEDKITNLYMNSYFKDNLWFEIVCYYILLKFIQRVKPSWEMRKNFELILSQFIIGKGFEYQVDVIFFLNDSLVLNSCKSGKTERSEIWELTNHKNEIKADTGIIFFFNEFKESYDGRRTNVYVFDNVKNKEFNKILEELNTIFSSVL